jgi:replicative DNA helicase
MEVTDLSTEDQQRLQQLAEANPDRPDDRPRYVFGEEVERLVLAAMLADRFFLVQAADLVSPKYFVHSARETICEVVKAFFEKYKTIPSRPIVKAAVLATGRPTLMFEAELDTVYDCYEPQLHVRDYLLDQIEEFAKVQAFKQAYMRSVDLVLSSDQEKWGKMHDLLKQPFLISRQRDLGLDYFEMVDERYARLRERKETEAFTSGFPEFDIPIKGGIGRGEMAAWLGSSGTGKSVLLVKTAVANIIKGKKVLFLSLEMDADKIATRFDAMFTRIPLPDLMLSHKEVSQILRGIYSEDPARRKLIIKQFPAGTADVNTFRAFHSQLKQIHGFVPDLVIVDYVGEMKDYPNMKTYESRQRLCRDLRAFGIEEQHATYTALQPNRSGKQQEEGGVMDDSFLGDSYGQIRVLDALWGINQSKVEKAAGVCRISNIKLRDGKGGNQIYCKQDPKTLDFESIDLEDYKRLMTAVKEEIKDAATFKIVDGDRPKKAFKPNKGDDQ